MSKLVKSPDENQEISIKTEQPKLDFTQFNKFQTYFYTSVPMFNMYTNFEMKQYAVMLLTNIGKGFPELARKVMDAYSATGFKAIESPAVLRALQSAKFVTGLGNPKIPQFIFYKQNKPKPAPKKKAIRKKTEKGYEFTEDIKADIMQIMLLDSKTFESFKFNKDVQELGLMLIDNKGYTIIDKVK